VHLPSPAGGKNLFRRRRATLTSSHLPSAKQITMRRYAVTVSGAVETAEGRRSRCKEVSRTR